MVTVLNENWSHRQCWKVAMLRGAVKNCSCGMRERDQTPVKVKVNMKEGGRVAPSNYDRHCV